MTITITITDPKLKAKYDLLEGIMQKRQQETANQDAIDAEFRQLMIKKVQKATSKYGPRKKEKMIEKELMEWNDALEILKLNSDLGG